jgi:phosphomevalonate kinase
MNVAHASAPGKLVVLGEYAVLEGHSALALAVDRRVKASAHRIQQAEIELCLPPLCPKPLRLPISASLEGRKGLNAGEGIPKLGSDLAWVLDELVPMLVSWSQEDVLYPQHHGLALSIDSTALYGSSQQKLGLGSSAAVAVAVAGVMLALGGQSLAISTLHQRVHRDHQGGKGSGIDVAACLSGGVIRYSMMSSSNQEPHWQRLAMWPDSLSGSIIHVKQSASTPQLIDAFKHWKRESPEAFKRNLSAMVACADQAEQAFLNEDWLAFLEGFTEYGERVGRMGDEMGQALYSEPHRLVSQLARTRGLAYKPCGAGMGDVGLLLSNDQDRAASACEVLAGMGFGILPLTVAEQGLCVNGESPWSEAGQSS